MSSIEITKTAEGYLKDRIIKTERITVKNFSKVKEL